MSDYDQLVGDYPIRSCSPGQRRWWKSSAKCRLRASLTAIRPTNVGRCRCCLSTRKARSALFSSQTWSRSYTPARIRSAPHSPQCTVIPSRSYRPGTGNSVGYYQGDTLVVDTVGVKTDRPYAMIDLFGTPYSKSLHVVERYRLREYDDVKDAIERRIKENWLPAGDVYSNHRGKFLQLHLTIEDAGVFTTPWTATLTYVPAANIPAKDLRGKHPSILLRPQRITPTFRAPRNRTSDNKDIAVQVSLLRLSILWRDTSG